jgi:hypothetical protein
MNDAIPPKTISELADQLDRIREELFSIQRALEKREPIEAAVEAAVESAVESAHTPNKGAVGC